MPAPNNTGFWVVCGVCLTIFVYVSTLNWMMVWAAIFRGKHSSWIPLVGSFFGVLGLKYIPIVRLHSWCWLPLILDWGCLPELLSTAWFFASGKHRLPRPPPSQPRTHRPHF